MVLNKYGVFVFVFSFSRFYKLQFIIQTFLSRYIILVLITFQI